MKLEINANTKVNDDVQELILWTIYDKSTGKSLRKILPSEAKNFDEAVQIAQEFTQSYGRKTVLACLYHVEKVLSEHEWRAPN